MNYEKTNSATLHFHACYWRSSGTFLTAQPGEGTWYCRLDCKHRELWAHTGQLLNQMEEVQIEKEGWRTGCMYWSVGVVPEKGFKMNLCGNIQNVLLRHIFIDSFSTFATCIKVTRAPCYSSAILQRLYRGCCIVWYSLFYCTWAASSTKHAGTSFLQNRCSVCPNAFSVASSRCSLYALPRSTGTVTVLVQIQ